jgi:hypothetical protein
MFGKEVALAVELGQAGFKIFDSLQDGKEPNVAPFAGRIFDNFVPDKFKAPLGPVSRAEFINAVFDVFKLFLKG